jgi:two-component system OmpR family response regulator
MKLLLVEDDAMLVDVITLGLRRYGWQVDSVGDAIAARLATLDCRYTAILLDLGLPGSSGFSVLANLRERYDTTPVLIVTARDKLSERIRGLDAGADDYIVKPFQLDELSARLRAVLRRSQGRVSPLLTYRDIEVDPARRTVKRAGNAIDLSMHEYRTLLALMERSGSAVSREQLEDMVYGSSGTIESNTIAVYVHHLRSKLGNDVIATVHGFGYRFGDTT